VYQPPANHIRQPPEQPGFDQAPLCGFKKGSWNPANYPGNERRITVGYVAGGFSAMLVFYLPIIIFEAMFEASNTRSKADESTVPLGD
jgi:hypothetical protein